MELASTPGGGRSVDTPGWRRWKIAGVCALLVTLVWMIFGQTRHFGFVNYDDDVNVSAAPQIVAGVSLRGIAWALTHEQLGHWAPLTALSRMMDCQIYGLWAGGHHLTNVLLHAVDAVLLFLVLRQFTGAVWRSGLVAALFAIHPLRVESVAWVSERKDVLSGLFFMLTLWAYGRYASRPPSVGRYAMVALCLTLGLMCKAMLVTVPFVLLLLDYWPLGRLKEKSQWPRLLLEKLPLLILSALSCVAAVTAAKKIIAPIDQLPLLARLGNALVAYSVYLGKFVYPSQLAVLYPLPKQGWGAWHVTLAALLLATVTAGAYILRRKQPFLLVGWLWYLGMLVPVIGIVQAGKLAYADRYTYLPQIGLGLAATWAAANLAGEQRVRRIALGAAAVVSIAVLAVAAYHQTSYWRSSETLWRHALDCTKDNDVAYNDLGNVLLLQGHTGEAIAQYREAVSINPDYAYARNNLAHLLFQEGRRDEAMAEYGEAVRSEPGSTAIRIRFGMDLFQFGQVTAAVSQFREALRIDPDCADAHTCLGNVMLSQGRPEEAIAEYREALRINPANALAKGNLERTLGMLPDKGGRRPEASGGVE